VPVHLDGRLSIEPTLEAKSTVEKLIPDGGEMGALIRAKDWSKTALGPIESWPQSFLSAVNICLCSTIPVTVMWGKDLLYVYNDSYREILGPQKHPAALGKGQHENFPEFMDFTVPMYQRILSTGVPEHYHELPLFPMRNGIVEEAFATISNSPLRDDQGKIAGIFHPIIEVTREVISVRRMATLRDLAARSVQASTTEDVCRKIIEVMDLNRHDIPFGLIYLIEQNGKVARLAGSLGVEQGSRLCPTSIPLMVESSTLWPLVKAFRDGIPVIVEAKDFGNIQSGPWPEPIREAMVLPFGGAQSGAPIGALIAGISPRRILDEEYKSFLMLASSQIATSITRLRAQEETLLRAEKLAEIDRAKTAFFSNVSHEFRTPLTLILGPIEDALMGPSKVLTGENLETVHRNSLRLLKLVNSLLEFARIEEGRTNAVFEPTELSEKTQDLASNFRAATERAGLRFVVIAEKLTGPVYVDNEMWEKIVLNLLSNALKFTFEGSIIVTLKQSGDFAELKVKDTGTGIPPEEIPLLFKRFHRVQGAKSRSHEGSGIGLALTHELVKLHHGTIEVESTLGEGTTFTVRIPMGKSHLLSHQLRAHSTSAPVERRISAYVEEAMSWTGTSFNSLDSNAEPQPMTSGENATILVVDDNSDMREYIARLLGPYWRIELAADGLAALEFAQKNPPDLVLSDIMMPRMSGFELLQALRADQKLKRIPIILLSARAGEESTIEGLEAGADDYLIKPFGAKELLARVQTHLKMTKLREEFEIEHQSLMARDEFLSVASHELQTPVTSLKLYVGNLLRNAKRGTDDVLSSESVVRKLEGAHSQIDRLVTLIDTLLDVTRISEGKLALNLSQIELVSFVQNIVENFPSGESGSKLNFEKPTTLSIFVLLDPVKFSQVINNVLSNAVRFGHGNPIDVSFSEDPTHILIHVRDYGLGMNKAESAKIFERFQQSFESRKVGGLGLGLYVSQKIVHAHGGTIRVESTPGHGSIFTIELPRGKNE